MRPASERTAPPTGVTSDEESHRAHSTGDEISHRAIRKARLLTLAERGAQAEADSRAIEREQFWDTLRTLVACLVWCAAGLAAMSWSVATTDAVWAPILFWGGMAVGNGGLLVTLTGAYARSGERNGW